MSENEILIFSDRNIKPTEELIFSAIGGKKILWQKIMSYLSDNYDDATGTWNYYNDGKQWLFKMVRKKKTIFWLAVMQGAFRITFYFSDKAEPELTASRLPRKVKDDFLSGKHYGKIRGITTKVVSLDDVEIVTQLIELKIRLK